MENVLLLNATYEPLRVVPLSRAMCLVLAKKAEIVEAASGVVRSATAAFPKPRVIRLTYYVKLPYKARLPLNRRNLMARDGGRCQYCSGKAETIDHVLPRSRGGRHVWENVVAACKPCNGRKADRLLSELGWRLECKPAAPTGTGWIVVGVGRTEPSWQPYLGAQLVPA